jgi:hypothetical protein
MLHATRASDPLPGPLTEDRKIEARDSTKKVEFSKALEMLAPMLIPPDWLELAASNLTGVQLSLNCHFYQETCCKASIAELKPQRNMWARRHE